MPSVHRTVTIVDLSAPITSSPPGTPEFQRTPIEYVDHAQGAAEIRQLYGVPPTLLRDREGWTRETLTLGTHNATRVDAPYHYTRGSPGSPLRRSTRRHSSASSGPESSSKSPNTPKARQSTSSTLSGDSLVSVPCSRTATSCCWTPGATSSTDTPTTSSADPA
jgi:hypothetical protein